MPLSLKCLLFRTGSSSFDLDHHAADLAAHLVGSALDSFDDAFAVWGHSILTQYEFGFDFRYFNFKPNDGRRQPLNISQVVGEIKNPWIFGARFGMIGQFLEGSFGSGEPDAWDYMAEAGGPFSSSNHVLTLSLGLDEI